MEKQVIFKSALNGFDKTSVLKYIDELNIKLNKAESDHQERLEELENEKDHLSDQMASLVIGSKEMQEQFEAERTALKEQLAEKQALVERMEAELRKLSQQVEEQEHELIMQREQNRLIREQAESVEVKSKKYDEAAASIGDAILAARQEASKIIDDAHAKADVIIGEAKVQAVAIVNDAQNKLNVTQERMEQLKAQFFTIRQQMNSSVALLNDQFGQLEASINPVVEEAAENETLAEESVVEVNKTEHPLKAILEQAANNQKKNFFRD